MFAKNSIINSLWKMYSIIVITLLELFVIVITHYLKKKEIKLNDKFKYYFYK